MCLRLREQCLCSEITSVARVVHVLLLRFVAGNMDVNKLASKRSELIRTRSDCSKTLRNPQKVDLCVLASFSCHVYAETQGRKVRPVAGFRVHCLFVRLTPKNVTIASPLEATFPQCHPEPPSHALLITSVIYILGSTFALLHCGASTYPLLE